MQSLWPTPEEQRAWSTLAANEDVMADCRACLASAARIERALASLGGDTLLMVLEAAFGSAVIDPRERVTEAAATVREIANIFNIAAAKVGPVREAFRSAIRKALLVTAEAGYYTDIALALTPLNDAEAKLRAELAAGE